jgi:transcriptional regulator GlxA family with amidase domain
MDAPPLRQLLARIHSFSPDLVARRPPAALLLDLLHDELAAPGPESTALARALAESVVLCVTRAVEDGARPAEPRRGRGSGRIAKAIALMDADLSRRWTVEALARAVALSRPVFARQFVQRTGVSPGRYLAGRRMERAAELLRESDAGLAQIAELVGYESEFAFSRAFKRHHGIPPGLFRRQSTAIAGATLRMAA